MLLSLKISLKMWIYKLYLLSMCKLCHIGSLHSMINCVPVYLVIESGH